MSTASPTNYLVLWLGDENATGCNEGPLTVADDPHPRLFQIAFGHGVGAANKGSDYQSELRYQTRDHLGASLPYAATEERARIPLAHPSQHPYMGAGVNAALAFGKTLLPLLEPQDTVTFLSFAAPQMDFEGNDRVNATLRVTSSNSKVETYYQRIVRLTNQIAADTSLQYVPGTVVFTHGIGDTYVGNGTYDADLNAFINALRVDLQDASGTPWGDAVPFLGVSLPAPFRLSVATDHPAVVGVHQAFLDLSANHVNASIVLTDATIAGLPDNGVVALNNALYSAAGQRAVGAQLVSSLQALDSPFFDVAVPPSLPPAQSAPGVNYLVLVLGGGQGAGLAHRPEYLALKVDQAGADAPDARVQMTSHAQGQSTTPSQDSAFWFERGFEQGDPVPYESQPLFSVMGGRLPLQNPVMGTGGPNPGFAMAKNLLRQPTVTASDIVTVASYCVPNSACVPDPQSGAPENVWRTPDEIARTPSLAGRGSLTEMAVQYFQQVIDQNPGFQFQVAAIVWLGGTEDALRNNTEFGIHVRAQLGYLRRRVQFRRLGESVASRLGVDTPILTSTLSSEFRQYANAQNIGAGEAVQQGLLSIPDLGNGAIVSLDGGLGAFDYTEADGFPGRFLAAEGIRELGSRLADLWSTLSSVAAPGDVDAQLSSSTVQTDTIVRLRLNGAPDFARVDAFSSGWRNPVVEEGLSGQTALAHFRLRNPDDPEGRNDVRFGDTVWLWNEQQERYAELVQIDGREQLRFQVPETDAAAAAQTFVVRGGSGNLRLNQAFFLHVSERPNFAIFSNTSLIFVSDARSSFQVYPRNGGFLGLTSTGQLTGRNIDPLNVTFRAP